MNIVETLSKLSNAYGISGFEDEIRKLLREFLKGYVDEVKEDKLGNLICIKKGEVKGPSIMLAAHMDEVGLQVVHVDKEGYIRFVPVGGIDPRVLPEQKVLVRSINGEYIPGVIGMKPPHLLEEEERKKVPKIKELFIDVGAGSREEVEKWGIKPGCPIFFDAKFTKTKNPERVLGKAFDDRVGCTVLTHVMEALKDEETVTVYAVGTIQEELGLRGAGPATFGISPDVALALDVCIPGDMPGVEEWEAVAKIGKGPAVGVREARMVASPAVVNTLIRLAEENNIPYQLDVMTRGATDSAAIQITGTGVPTAAVNVPTRYIHGALGLVSLKDVENAVKLVKVFILSLGSR